MKKSVRFITAQLVSIVLVAVCGCSVSAGGDWTDFLMPDSAEVTVYRENLSLLYGEVWHNGVYDKDAIKIPQVAAEETVKGELWFLPINNTAPLEEIAPVISYELML